MQNPACNITQGKDMNFITDIFFRQVHVIVVLIPKSVFKLEHTVIIKTILSKHHVLFNNKVTVCNVGCIVPASFIANDGDRKQVGHG